MQAATSAVVPVEGLVVASPSSQVRRFRLGGTASLHGNGRKRMLKGGNRARWMAVYCMWLAQCVLQLQLRRLRLVSVLIYAHERIEPNPYPHMPNTTTLQHQ